MKAPLPNNEAARLSALRRYEILDTEREEAFDRLTALVARVLDLPMVFVTLLDAERQWFKSSVGLGSVETSRDTAFCAHAILQDTPMVVTDALEDARFTDNPHVTGDPHVRFYAGAPLRTPDGFNLGTFCAIDSRPRGISEQHLKLLQDMAAVVVNELELRRLTRELTAQSNALNAALQQAERHKHLFERIAHTSPEVIYVLDLETRKNTYVNRDAIAQLGYSRTEVGQLGNELLPTLIHPEDVAKVVAHFSEFQTMRDDERTELIYRVRDTSNAYRWFRARENVFSRHADGRAREILGVASDITALKQNEERLAQLATTDELTGLANHRAFRERLATLLLEAERGRAFALCLVDIDHFKRINDNHGHPVGDRALAVVAKTLAENVRKVDQVARYGGEEFSILLGDTTEENAAALAERLRQSIACTSDPLPVTASFGIAGFVSGLNASSLLERADNALYCAKRQGRNRVVAFANLPESA